MLDKICRIFKHKNKNKHILCCLLNVYHYENLKFTDIYIFCHWLVVVIRTISKNAT